MENMPHYRHRVVVQKRVDSQVWINNKRYLDFSSNDYLGIRSDEKVKATLTTSAEFFGFGSGASAHVSGYYSPHQELEERFAAFLGREKAVYFSSGYLANLGVLTSIIGRKDVVILDKYCHGSIIDGLRLSRANYFRYQHNNLNEFSRLFKLNNNCKRFVVTESIFGMEGDVSPISEIVKITVGNSTLIVDDAHGVGVLGENGAGVCEKFNLSAADVHVLVVPLGKAFGSCGAIVSGDIEIIDAILQFSRTYLLTTALPPVIPKTTLTCLDIVINEKWRREKLKENIQHFNEQAKKRNITLISDDMTPVRCLLIKDASSVLALKSHLTDKDFLVSAIRPPTVPKNGSRIRISLSAFHEKADISCLLDHIGEYCERN